MGTYTKGRFGYTASGRLESSFWQTEKQANNLKLAFQLVPAFSGNSDGHSHIQLDYSREMTKRYNNIFFNSL
jgi:hypothetical protein